MAGLAWGQAGYMAVLGGYMKIRPCPFCGFVPKMAKRKGAKGSSTGYWWTVRCPICRAYGPRSHDENGAIDLWNDRIK